MLAKKCRLCITQRSPPNILGHLWKHFGKKSQWGMIKTGAASKVQVQVSSQCWSLDTQRGSSRSSPVPRRHAVTSAVGNSGLGGSLWSQVLWNRQVLLDMRGSWNSSRLWNRFLSIMVTEDPSELTSSHGRTKSAPGAISLEGNPETSCVLPADQANRKTPASSTSER